MPAAGGAGGLMVVEQKDEEVSARPTEASVEGQLQMGPLHSKEQIIRPTAASTPQPPAPMPPPPQQQQQQQQQQQPRPPEAQQPQQLQSPQPQQQQPPPAQQQQQQQQLPPQLGQQPLQLPPAQPQQQPSPATTAPAQRFQQPFSPPVATVHLPQQGPPPPQRQPQQVQHQHQQQPPPALAPRPLVPRQSPSPSQPQQQQQRMVPASAPPQQLQQQPFRSPPPPAHLLQQQQPQRPQQQQQQYRPGQPALPQSHAAPAQHHLYQHQPQQVFPRQSLPAAPVPSGAASVAPAVSNRVVEDLVKENDALRKSLTSLRKDYERTNVELKERIRTLQLELEQDRSRVINEAVGSDHARLREVMETLLEANREIPDVLPTKVLGQVTKSEVKQVLKAGGFSMEYLQEAATAIETCISDTSYDPFERDEDGQIVSQNPGHDMLFPLRQQFGDMAVDLVLIKKQELDQADDAARRAVLWVDGHELGVLDGVRRLIDALIEARQQAQALNGGQQNKGGGVCWEEWLGFQSGRVGTAPHERSVIGEDIVEGYKAWVARSRQVSARSAGMYLNDLNKVFRLCFRALGLPDETMNHQALLDFCTANWALVEQEAANQKSKSVDQGLSYLKGYLHLEDGDVPPEDESSSPGGAGRVPCLGESVLEGYSVWLNQNTGTKQTTWKSYGRAIESVVGDVLKSAGREGAMLEADEIRDFVIQHREELEKRAATDARRYVGACVRYFLRFLGLVEEPDIEARKEEGGGGAAVWEHGSDGGANILSTPVSGGGGGGKSSSAPRSSYARRSNDRLPLEPMLAESYGRYLVKKAGMKEGTSVEYVRYVGTWINDLLEMDDVEVPAVDNLDQTRMISFVTTNEPIIRKYGEELKAASKKGKVSAWRHFMIFLGLAGPEEDWITGSALHKAPTQMRVQKLASDGIVGPPALPPAVLDGAVRSSFTAFLLDRDQGAGLAKEEVKAYVSSAERSLRACMKAEQMLSAPLPKDADGIRSFATKHMAAIQQFADGLKKKPRAALRYLLEHVGTPVPRPGGVTETKDQDMEVEQQRVAPEVQEPSREGPLGVSLVTAFAAWLRGEKPLTNAEVQGICKAVVSIMAQAYKDAGVQEEGNELLYMEAAQAFVAGKKPELEAVYNTAFSRQDGSPVPMELALFKSFLEQGGSADTGMAVGAGGAGGEEEMVGALLMDEFAAEAVEQGLSGQMAALQVLHVLSQIRRRDAATSQGGGEAEQTEVLPLQTKEDVVRFLSCRKALGRVVQQAPSTQTP